MNVSLRVPKPLLALLSAVALIVLGLSVASADGGSPGGNPAPASAPGRALSVRAALEGGDSEVYTGIKPCRVLDTRPSTPLVNAGRNFKVSGNLTGQGGLTNCGIPTNATSIAINLTGISTGSTGFIRGWAYTGASPTATLLNFGPGINVSNQVNIPLCRGNGCTYAFVLRAYGSADIVGDAVGYYTAPMFGLVSDIGALSNSSGITGVVHNSTGEYDVTFDRNVTGCAPQVSDEIYAYNRDATPSAFNGNTVHVVVRDTNNALVDTWFYISVTC